MNDTKSVKNFPLVCFGCHTCKWALWINAWPCKNNNSACGSESRYSHHWRGLRLHRAAQHPAFAFPPPAHERRSFCQRVIDEFQSSRCTSPHCSQPTSFHYELLWFHRVAVTVFACWRNVVPDRDRDPKDVVWRLLWRPVWRTTTQGDELKLTRQHQAHCSSIQ